MQNYCKTIGALAAASALVAGTASAEIEYEIHGGYTNEYVFRGVELGDDLIEAGVDLATEYNGIGLSAGVWQADYDTREASNTETDLYGEASYDLGFATGAIGYIWYINEDNGAGVTNDDYQEVYFSLSRDLGFADASLTYYWDVEGDNDGYAELGLSRSFELSPCVALGLSSKLGYAVEEGDFANWVTTASIDWAFTETATLSPFVSLAVEGDADALYGSNGGETQLFGGSMLSVSF